MVGSVEENRNQEKVSKRLYINVSVKSTVRVLFTVFFFVCFLQFLWPSMRDEPSKVQFAYV